MVHPDKVEWVDDLEESVRETNDMVFSNYKGLTVEEFESLRRELYEEESRYKVVKNRLAEIAFERVFETNGDGTSDDADDEADISKQENSDTDLDDLPGVGPSKREALEDQGFHKLSDVSQAELDALSDVSGVGTATAEKLKQAASELLENSVDEQSSTAANQKQSSNGDAHDADLDQIRSMLNNNTGISFHRDGFVGAAKVVVEFAEEHEKFQIKGGLLDGEYLDPDGVKQVSELPSRPELLTSLATVLQKPIQKLVRNLNYPINQLANVLNKVRDDKES